MKAVPALPYPTLLPPNYLPIIISFSPHYFLYLLYFGQTSAFKKAITEMSETQPVDSQNKENMSNEAKEEEQKTKKQKVSQKKKKENKEEYILAVPEKTKSLYARIANATLEILKQEPLLSEKEIILRMIAKDQIIKEYFMRTQDISYIKYVIRQLAEKKYILRARIFGENKRVYFLLPEQLDQFKDRIIKAPK